MQFYVHCIYLIVKGVFIMAQTSINIRIDEDLKKQVESLFSEFGMNMTTAFTIFAKAIFRKKKITFEISAVTDDFYNEYNQDFIKKSMGDIKAGKGVAHELIEVAESKGISPDFLDTLQSVMNEYDETLKGLINR